MEIEERIVEIISPIVTGFGVDLVETELRGRPGSFRLTIFVDRPEGISIDLCTKISQKLTRSEALDELLGARYRLEVSSPGVDRPLKRPEDFRRKLGVILDIRYTSDQKERKIKGKLKEVTEEAVYLQAAGDEVAIPFERITKAVQALPW